MGLGCQINIDKGETLNIESGKIISDIYQMCPSLEITFNCNRQLVFNDSSDCYITYYDMDWTPSEYKCQYSNTKGWHYEMLCFPKQFFDYVSQPYRNTAELATRMGLKFDIGANESIDFIAPLINLPFSKLINHYRTHFIEEMCRTKNVVDGKILYFTDSLYSKSLQTILNQEAELFKGSVDSQHLIGFCDDIPTCELYSNKQPKPYNQKDYLLKLFGKKFEYEGIAPVQFLKMYTLSFDDCEQLNFDYKFLCIRSERDVTKENGFYAIFAEVMI